MKRFHVHVHVDDLARNIAFYNAMFGQEPARTESIPVFREPAAGRKGGCCG